MGVRFAKIEAKAFLGSTAEGKLQKSVQQHFLEDQGTTQASPRETKLLYLCTGSRGCPRAKWISNRVEKLCATYK